MLKQFSVRNFKNFSDTIALDLRSGRYTFNKGNDHNGILKNAIIYGYNACGKSNLALALFDIVASVTDKWFDASKYLNYQNVHHQNTPAEFSYCFMFGDNELVYSYQKANWQSTLSETLSINGKTMLVFHRQTGKFQQSFAGAESLDPHIANPTLAAVKYIRANASLDPHNKDNQVFLAFCQFVDRMLLFWCLQDRSYVGYETGRADLFTAICNEDHLDRYNDFLKDMGIDRHIVARRMPDGTILPYYDFGNNHLLPYQSSTMSNGESSLMLFFYWLVEIEDKQSPSLVVIDEFDAFYHIKLSRKLMQILQKRVSGQVILTTHNDTLISNEILRPDSYFFLKNNRIQAFDKIAGKEIREAHNLRRMFDAGVFDPE